MEAKDYSQREILRYLGYGRQEADPAVLSLIDACTDELSRSVSPKSIYFEYPLTVLEDGTVACAAFTAVSRNLSRNLKDCSRILLFAATLGTGADMLIHKYTRLQMSKAVVMQAAATAMIEEYCDSVNRALKAEYEKKALFLRPRFSPGYGDFPLECQRGIVSVLQTGKRIGLTLTDSLIMTPVKSVTAVIGISEKPGNCEIRGCEACGKTDCAYRRG